MSNVWFKCFFFYCVPHLSTVKPVIIAIILETILDLSRSQTHGSCSINSTTPPHKVGVREVTHNDCHYCCRHKKWRESVQAWRRVSSAWNVIIGVVCSGPRILENWPLVEGLWSESNGQRAKQQKIKKRSEREALNGVTRGFYRGIFVWVVRTFKLPTIKFEDRTACDEMWWLIFFPESGFFVDYE